MATVYAEALAHPDWCPIQAQDCWTELPRTLWTPLQRRLLDAMPGERLVPQALELPGVTVPRRLAAVPVQAIQSDATIQPRGFPMAPTLPTSRLVRPQ